MGIMAKKPDDFEREPLPAGQYHSICYSVIDLGTHVNERWGSYQRKVMITWEIPELRKEYEKDGKEVNLPQVISNRYTLSLSDKSYLKRDLESWRGRGFTFEEEQGFDISKLLGINCLLNIIHTEKDKKVYANIASVTPLIKSMEKKEAENPLIWFSLEDHPEIPDGIPEWIVKIIHKSEEWVQKISTPDFDNATPPMYEDEEDIPF